MNTPLVVRDHFNRRFLLYSRQTSNMHVNVTTVNFLDTLSAVRFLRNLLMDAHQWPRLLKEIGHHSSSRSYPGELSPLDSVAKLLVRGYLSVAELESGDETQRHNRTVKATDDKQYYFGLAADMLIERGRAVRFSGQDAASQFYQNLSVSAKQHAAIEMLITSTAPRGGNHSIASALADGRIVAIERSNNSMITGKSGAGAEQATTTEAASVDMPGNRQVNALGPAAVQAAPQESPDAQVIEIQKAQAKAAEAAAESGAPFCEECEKKSA